MSIRPTVQPDQSASIWIALAVSVLFHVPMLFALSQIEFDEQPFDPTSFEAANELSVTLVDEQDPEEKKKEEEEEDDELEKMQFVSLPPPDVEKVPQKANYLDQYASEADQETVRKAAPGAPVTKAAQNLARLVKPETPEIPQPEEPSQETVPEQEPTENQEKTEDDQGELSKANPEPVDLRREANRPDSSGVPDPRQLFPNPQNTDVMNPRGEDGSMDYLRDVAEGDKTLLNRKRSRYWAFFDRIKVQIADEWSPATEYRRRDPYGNVYGVKDRFSAVKVTLNGDGSVRQLYVSRPSGLEFFDDEAVRSVRAAAPFHNPPEGLKDEDGLIHFTFGFYFEITSGTSLRLFN